MSTFGIVCLVVAILYVGANYYFQWAHVPLSPASSDDTADREEDGAVRRIRELDDEHEWIPDYYGFDADERLEPF